MSHSPESFNSEDYSPEDALLNEVNVSDVAPETTSPDEADMPNGEVPNNELETTNELEETSPEKQSILEDPPEGYKNANDIAKDNKVSYDTVKNIAKKLGIAGKEYRGKNGKGTVFYSPEEVERIIKSDEMQKLLTLGGAPEGYKNASNIAEDESLKNKVNYNIVINVAKKLGIAGKEYRGKNGKGTIFYSPEEVERIIKSDEMQKLLTLGGAPEGYKTRDDIATSEPLKDKVSARTVAIIAANKLGIDGKEYRCKNGIGKVAIFYSPEEVERIINSDEIQKLLALEEAPEGYKTGENIVTDELPNSKVSATTIRRVAKKLGINGKKYRDKMGRETNYYSPEEVERIIKSDEIQKLLALEEVPEGYKTASNIATDEPLNGKVSKGTVERVAKKLGIDGKEYRDERGHAATFYSPEEVERIINSEKMQKLLALEEAPEGYKTAGDIVTDEPLNSKVSAPTVTGMAKNLGVTGKEYRGKNGQAATFYSLEEQLDIIEAVEKTIPRTSFPEKAFAFYLKQTGKNIKDNIRPDWMKNPSTNRNLEIDVYIENDNPPPPGFGIEYDGVNFHGEDKVERDSLKNRLARNNGVEIIHIRENGCPELPDEIPCITRKDDNHTNEGLKECIEQCFVMLNMPLPETGIDITRDQSEIFALVNAENDVNQRFDDTEEEDTTKTAA